MYGRCSVENVGSNPTGDMNDCCFVCVMYCQLDISDELITRLEESYRMCCVAVCDLETSRKRRPWPAFGRRAAGEYIYIYICVCVCVFYEEHTSGKGLEVILRTKNFYQNFL
jgi:hypothetical protein